MKKRQIQQAGESWHETPPAYRLAIAIMKQAADDLADGRYNVASWIRSSPGFVSWCEWLGVEPEYLRRNMLAAFEGNQ